MLLQFEELENLGYCGFAVAFFEDKMELVSTSSMSDSFHPQLIEYLHALTITGEVKCASIIFTAGMHVVIQDYIFHFQPTLQNWQITKQLVLQM